MASCAARVRFWGQSGHPSDTNAELENYGLMMGPTRFAGLAMSAFAVAIWR